MDKFIYTDIDGNVVVGTPTTSALNKKVKGLKVTIDDIAKRDVPRHVTGQNEDGSPVFGEKYPYRLVKNEDLPASRNWRNAWTDENPTQTIDVDLEKAKHCHKDLMMAVCVNRLPIADGIGRPLEGAVVELSDAINNIDLENIKTLEELYSVWVPALDIRTAERVYEMHKK